MIELSVIPDHIHIRAAATNDERLHSNATERSILLRTLPTTTPVSSAVLTWKLLEFSEILP